MRKTGPILTMVLGIALVVGGIAGVIGGIVSGLGDMTDPWSVPGQQTMTLQEGSWVVYEVSPGLTATYDVDPESVRVTGPGGVVSTTCIPCGATTQTLTVGNTTYGGLASFSVPVASSYTIAVTGGEGSVAVGPSVVSGLGRVLGWIAATVFGFLVALAGLVWLIVALAASRRAAESDMHRDPSMSATSAAPGQAASPTGNPVGSWYPDPTDPSRLRWWDGRQWTDYTQDR